MGKRPVSDPERAAYSPRESPDEGLTPAFYAWKARFDAETAAYERWEAMTPREKFEEIVMVFPAEEWVLEENLNALAVFRNDPGRWLRVITIGREIGVNIFQLDKAITAILDRHARWKLAEMRRAVETSQEIDHGRNSADATS